ncbi:MAG: hypothetical protein EBS07_11170 [Sphingobacteriia bacterium]|nr:hypothetical protein [Sphingobacteriia bacterium]
MTDRSKWNKFWLAFNKKKMKKDQLTITTSSIVSYVGIKTIENKIDPFTRMSLGLLATVGLSLSENQTTRNIGLGLGIASLLQLLDIKKGGKITRNDSNIQFYVLDENQGVTILEPGQTPSNSIDGLTFKGLNGVFKVSDGVYVELGNDNSINYSFGFGKLINQNLRSGGYKSKQWVDQQTDLRWKELYRKSI